MAEAITTSPPPTLSSPLRVEPLVLSCHREICILVSLANRGDSWGKSTKYRWGAWECSAKRPYLVSRCYFAIYLSLFFRLEHGSICWCSSGHFVIKRASPRACQKHHPGWWTNENPLVADLWTSCYVGGRDLLWYSHCLSQVSTCCITEILIHVGKDNRCIAQLTNTRHGSRLRPCEVWRSIFMTLNPSDPVANTDLGNFFLYASVSSPAKQG